MAELRVLCAVLVAGLLVSGCGGSGSESADTMTTSTAPSTTTTTIDPERKARDAALEQARRDMEDARVEYEDSRFDEGFFEACAHIELGRVVGMEAQVPAIITWLGKSLSPEAQELGEKLTVANPAGVQALLTELTQDCVADGWDYSD